MVCSLNNFINSKALNWIFWLFLACSGHPSHHVQFPAVSYLLTTALVEIICIWGQ